MQNLRNKLIAGGAVLILAAIGTVMNRQAARADGGPTVTIAAPLPLPVTGTVAVTGNVATTGTVAATQSGPWNVSITGTPNVTVANPATAPLFNLNVSDKGRIAYQKQTQDLGNCNAALQPCALTAPVPFGHRLVIEHVSLDFSVFSSATFVRIFLHNGTYPVSAFNATANMAAYPTSNVVDVDQPVLAYIDSGDYLFFNVAMNNGTNAFPGFQSAVTGYMLDCTIAPCAAIAH
jgi:hypothetical protein